MYSMHTFKSLPFDFRMYSVHTFKIEASSKQIFFPVAIILYFGREFFCLRKFWGFFVDFFFMCMLVFPPSLCAMCILVFIGSRK